MNSREIEKVKLFISNAKNNKPLNDISDIIVKYRHFAKYYKKLDDEYEKKNKVYTYLLTFTINPSWHDVKDVKIHDEVETYVFGYAINRHALRAHLVREGGDETHKHTHFHLGMETQKYIDFSNSLKYYRKTYGMVDISRSYSNQYNDVLKYLSKVNIPVSVGHNQT